MNVSRSRKSFAIVMTTWLVAAGVGGYLVKDRALSDMRVLVVWVVATIAVLYPISAFANWVNRRHDAWLRAHGLPVPATVVACFVPGASEVSPYEAATYTVIALGTHPVTQQKTQFRFFTNHPLWYRYGTPVQMKVNRRNAADYLCESDGAL